MLADISFLRQLKTHEQYYHEGDYDVSHCNIVVLL